MTNLKIHLSPGQTTRGYTPEFLCDDFRLPSLDISNISLPDGDLPAYSHPYNGKNENVNTFYECTSIENILSDDDSEFEYVTSEDYSIEDISEEEENLLAPANYPLPPPFWFANEDEDHICYIMNRYSATLILPRDRKNRSEQPFISRIKRTNVSTDPDDFQTLDYVTIANCQRMPISNLILPDITAFYCLTTWSIDDGIPIRITKLDGKQTSYWLQKLTCENYICTPSFLYCCPDWNYLVSHREATATDAEYHYYVSSEYNENTYHGLPCPGNYAPYVSDTIPKCLRVKNPMILSDVACF